MDKRIKFLKDNYKENNLEEKFTEYLKEYSAFEAVSERVVYEVLLKLTIDHVSKSELFFGLNDLAWSYKVKRINGNNDTTISLKTLNNLLMEMLIVSPIQ